MSTLLHETRPAAGIGDAALEAVLDELTDLVVVADRRGVIVHLNRAALTLGAVGHRFWDTFAALEEQREAESAFQARSRWDGLVPDGEGRRLLRWTFTEVERDPRLVLCKGTDVTDHQRVADALRASEARLRGVAASLPGMLFQLALDERGEIGFRHASESARDLLGLAPDVLLADASAFLSRVPSRERARLRSGLQRSARTLGAWQWRGRYRHPDGTVRWLQARSRPQCRDDTVQWDGLLADVTEEREMQERLAINDRLSSVGLLAAGVAHEINNPLSYVLGHLELLANDVRRQRERLPDELAEKFDKKIAAALHGAHRVQRIVQDLRSFSRSESVGSGPVDVHGALGSALQMASNEIRHRANLVRELEEVPPVHGDESRLAQVFLNLLINAAQAIPEGRVAANEVRVRTGVAEDGRVFVEVRDTGCGMPPDVAARVFDPFYTTKPVGVGTGLGLSICHSILEDLGGEIVVESVPGAGTTFRVLLVASEDLPVEETPGLVDEPTTESPARILVVDDEPDIAFILKRTFEEHQVSVADSGRQALELIESSGAFDVVFCDLLMPELSGMDLFETIRERWPGLERRVVFMTGGAFTPRSRAFMEGLANRCIEKPFDLHHLRTVVAEVLVEAAEDAD